MKLENELKFRLTKQATILIEIPVEGEDEIVIGLYGPLRQSQAECLGIDWLFADERSARSGIKEAVLPKESFFVNVELKLISPNGEIESFYVDKVANWRVFSVSNGAWNVQCKVFMTGRTDSILDFLRNNRACGFEWALISRQGSLFADQDAEPEEEENPVVLSEDDVNNLFDPETCAACGGADHHKDDCPMLAGSLEVAADIVAEQVAPKRRGRPPGSKNKASLAAV